MEDTPTENTQAEARKLKNMKIQNQGNIRQINQSTGHISTYILCIYISDI